ncbi:MAG: hypothetical protein JWP89_1261 [Schlesneria sp.]|nr:hypothetical protein [Schlesneria sp.]
MRWWFRKESMPASFNSPWPRNRRDYLLLSAVVGGLSLLCCCVGLVLSRGGESRTVAAVPKADAAYLSLPITLTKDLGCIRSAELPVKVQFFVKNPSRTIWTLVAKRSSCTCTVAALSFSEIKPGDVEPVELVLSPPSTISGPYRQTVDLRFADPSGVETTVTLLARFALGPLLSASSSTLNVVIPIPYHDGNVESSQVITLRSYADHDIATPEVSGLPPFLAATATSVQIEEGYGDTAVCVPRQCWRYKVTPIITGDLPYGKSTHPIAFRSSSSPDFSAKVEVSCTVKGPLMAFPESIRLKRMSVEGDLVGSTFVSLDSGLALLDAPLVSKLIDLNGVVTIERRSPVLLCVTVQVKQSDVAEAGGAPALTLTPVMIGKAPPLVLPVSL